MAVNHNDWQTLAACSGHPRADDFYPPFHTERKHERVARERRAKAVCAACPVRNSCLEHALAVEERYGVWGGLSTEERRLVTLTA